MYDKLTYCPKPSHFNKYSEHLFFGLNRFANIFSTIYSSSLESRSSSPALLDLTYKDGYY